MVMSDGSSSVTPIEEPIIGTIPCATENEIRKVPPIVGSLQSRLVVPFPSPFVADTNGTSLPFGATTCRSELLLIRSPRLIDVIHTPLPEKATLCNASLTDEIVSRPPPDTAILVVPLTRTLQIDAATDVVLTILPNIALITT